MPKIFDENSEFPKYFFSSREELAEFFRSEIDRVLPEISRQLGFKDGDVVAKIRAGGEREIQREIDHLWEECSRKEGKVQVAVTNNRTTRVSRRISRDFMEDYHHSNITEPAREQHIIRREPQINRGLVFAGLAAGAILTVHGAGTALTATDRDGEGHQRRNWERTALHAVEALGGAALSWVSLVALRRGNVRLP